MTKLSIAIQMIEHSNAHNTVAYGALMINGSGDASFCCAIDVMFVECDR